MVTGSFGDVGLVSAAGLWIIWTIQKIQKRKEFRNEGERSPRYMQELSLLLFGVYEECMKLLGSCQCLDGIGAEQSSNDDGA